jgi:hypothetical protein
MEIISFINWKYKLKTILKTPYTKAADRNSYFRLSPKRDKALDFLVVVHPK